MDGFGKELMPREWGNQGKRKRPKLRSALATLFLVTSICLLTVWGVGLLDRGTTSSDAGTTTEANAGTSAENDASLLPAGATGFEGEPPPYVDAETGAWLDSEELVEMVGPTVVSIVTETVSQGWFWQAIPQTGAGTGVIISPDGYIVTNNHVVEDAQKVTVTLSDGRTFEAADITTDPQTDLAVVQIDASDLPYLHFLGNSLDQLHELEHVVAVGNALALPGGPTWTEGVVSNLGRSIDLGDGVVLYDVIQTDAAINPGNSGGPLVNMAGQLVGINVAIAADAENIGFAISTDTAIPVVKSLIEEGQVVRPWLGVTMLTVNSIVSYQYRLSVDRGVLIVEVSDGSPADEAGLRPDDVVTGIDEQGVNTSEEMRSVIQAHEPGDQVEIEFFRGSEQKMTTAVLGEAPAYF
ncbi:MAG: trypsin-like peptidase domain-containing protein [Dehalococcoidia bacterium]|nr:trypsin-like peptidase domain-containing protein [Dehalococcoidia bacterium]